MEPPLAPGTSIVPPTTIPFRAVSSFSLFVNLSSPTLRPAGKGKQAPLSSENKLRLRLPVQKSSF